ncbi:MAG: hypothetical protein U0904_01380 [Candidatus Nanopelagicales bacterium]|nr:hypothetical protein [Candidatus Nanopelagicales bacterium]
MSEFSLHGFVKAFDECGDVGGCLSSFLGEDLLLDLRQDYLTRVEGRTVAAIDGKPRRDDSVFIASGATIPAVRDLDGWLTVNAVLEVVEAKSITSNSLDGEDLKGYTADQICTYAKDQFDDIAEMLRAPEWNSWNKILLPVRGGDPIDQRTIRRSFVVWRPVSESGELTSSVTAETLTNSGWVDTRVEVFSGSLYVRHLLAHGVTSVPLLRVAAKIALIDALWAA